jgi:diguanylate cyclase (GGDEF)-like protein
LAALDWQRLRLRTAGWVAARSGRTEAVAGVLSELAHLAPMHAPGLVAADITLVRSTLEEQLGQAFSDEASLLAGAELQASRCAPARGACDSAAAWALFRLLALQAERRGQWVQARQWEQRAADRARAADDPLALAWSLSAQSVLSARLGEADVAHRLIQSALREARRHGDATALVRVRVNEARLAVHFGDGDGHRSALEEAVRLSRSLQAPRLTALLQLNMADVFRRRGDHDLGMAAVKQAKPVFERHRDLRLLAVLLHNEGLLHLAKHQREAARQDLAEARRIWKQASADGLSLAALEEASEAWAAAGDARSALQLFHEAQALRAQIEAKNREAITAELRQRFQTEATREHLALLAREGELKSARLQTETQLQRIWGLTLVTLVWLAGLVAWLIRRSREATRELQSTESLLRFQAERDPLTGLANRRRCVELLSRHSETQGFQGALLLLDVDHFKQINDTWGHNGGDGVLIEVGRRLAAAVRADDLVCRWGGEEFLVLAPDLTGPALDSLALRLLSRVAQEPVCLPDGRQWAVTASLGYASFPLAPAGQALGWEPALHLVDMALYTAKAQGRDCAVGLSCSESAPLGELSSLVQDFDAARAAGHWVLQVRRRGASSP